MQNQGNGQHYLFHAGIPFSSRDAFNSLMVLAFFIFLQEVGDEVEDDSEIYAWEAIGWLAILTVWVSILSGYLVDAIQVNFILIVITSR